MNLDLVFTTVVSVVGTVVAFFLKRYIGKVDMELSRLKETIDDNDHDHHDLERRINIKIDEHAKESRAAMHEMRNEMAAEFRRLKDSDERAHSQIIDILTKFKP